MHPTLLQNTWSHTFQILEVGKFSQWHHSSFILLRSSYFRSYACNSMKSPIFYTWWYPSILLIEVVPKNGTGELTFSSTAIQFCFLAKNNCWPWLCYPYSVQSRGCVLHFWHEKKMFICRFVGTCAKSKWKYRNLHSDMHIYESRKITIWIGVGLVILSKCMIIDAFLRKIAL